MCSTCPCLCFNLNVILWSAPARKFHRLGAAQFENHYQAKPKTIASPTLQPLPSNTEKHYQANLKTITRPIRKQLPGQSENNYQANPKNITRPIRKSSRSSQSKQVTSSKPKSLILEHQGQPQTRKCQTCISQKPAKVSKSPIDVG